MRKSILLTLFLVTTLCTSSWFPRIVDAAPRRIAQAGGDKGDNPSTNSTKETPTPKDNSTPAGAWILESVGATVAAVGFIVLGYGATTLGRRDQLLAALKSSSSPLFTPERPKATEVKELQDVGYPLLVAGIITSSVGLALMVGGAIWLLVHKPPHSDVPSDKMSRTPLPPSANGPTMVLLRAH